MSDGGPGAGVRPAEQVADGTAATGAGRVAGGRPHRRSAAGRSAVEPRLACASVRPLPALGRARVAS
jgi:hypothetical protein